MISINTLYKQSIMEQYMQSVEAIQVSKDNLDEIIKWLRGIGKKRTNSSYQEFIFFTKVGVDGPLMAIPGQWIVKDMHGNYSVVSDTIFRERYTQPSPAADQPIPYDLSKEPVNAIRTAILKHCSPEEMAELKDWLDTYKLPVKEQPQYLTIEELIKLSDVELQDEINKLRSKLGMRKEQPQNATFESALEAELNKIPYTKHVDDGQYNDGQLAGFEKGAEWARGRSFPAEDGPWKFEVHHDQGPEDCDEWVTITDGNVTLRFDQHQDEEGEEKIVALLNQLKAKISYDRSAEHVVGYLQEQLDALRASNPSGITWVRASERLPNHKNDVSLKIDGQKYSVGKMQLGLLLVDLWEGYADTTQLLERIYWLDESSPASQGREVGYKEPKSDFAHLGQEAEWIINMVYEGAALWQQEYDACRRILQELVSLKLVKEREGKTTEYQERQPKAWSTAIEFLNKYQHF